MGRGKRDQRKFRRDFKNHRPDVWRGDSNNRADGYRKSNNSNELFEEYYQKQDIVPEGEWEEFLRYLRMELPITFRINGSGQFANELRDKFDSDFFSHFHDGPLEVDGEQVAPPVRLPWYPNGYAYQLDFSRHQLRKHAVLTEIHEFMKRVTEAGSISRQEAVSMIPPLFLDVEPHHRVLDMCAAPGSKTFQILEALHAVDANGTGDVPTGFVIANDAEAQRCNLLTHQTKRMCSPCLMVTNHEAQKFPEIFMKGQDGKPELMEFDRILADVPCSGDGTLRKAPDIWNRWSVGSGNGLHLLQLKISLQACRLLKVGGRMVYSTCTFNPIEDEAVVAELLVRCNGAMRLVDVSAQLPELKRCPGKKTWKVRDRYRWYDTWEEACDLAYKLDPSMFCSEEKSALPLERCMRVLPHQQNTGGFFIAVLEKVAPIDNFVWPNTRHRYNATTGAVDLKDGGELKDLLGSAKLAAEKAVQAATDCLAAFEAGDADKIGELAEVAQAAAARARLMADTADEDAKIEAAKRPKKSEGQDVASAAAAEEAEGKETGAAVEVADGVDAAANGVVHDGEKEEGKDVDMDEKEEGKEDAAAEDADKADKDGAMEVDAAPVPEADPPSTSGGAQEADPPASSGAAPAPSWVRGGGQRHRPVPGGKWRDIDAIMPVEDPAILKMLVEFYGLGEEFTMHEQLITRTLEHAIPKRLSFVTKQIMDLLIADEKEKLKITALGIKLFERQNMKPGITELCCYRIAQEGLPFLLPHVTKQRIYAGSDVILQLLKDRLVGIPQIKPRGFSADPKVLEESEVAGGDEATAAVPDTVEPAEAEASAPAEATDKAAADAKAQKQPPAGKAQPNNRPNMSEIKPLRCPEFISQLEDVMYGCAVCILKEEEAKRLGFPTDSQASGALTANAPLAICIWRSTSSINVLVSKPESVQLVDKLESAIKKLQTANNANANGGAGGAQD